MKYKTHFFALFLSVFIDFDSAQATGRDLYDCVHEYTQDRRERRCHTKFEEEFCDILGEDSIQVPDRAQMEVISDTEILITEQDPEFDPRESPLDRFGVLLESTGDGGGIYRHTKYKVFEICTSLECGLMVPFPSFDGETEASFTIHNRRIRYHYRCLKE